MVNSDKTQTLATQTNWQSPPWRMLAVVTMVTTAGHRPVSPTRGEPARMPRGRPAVEQVSANKQSARAEKQRRKNRGSHNHSSSLHHSSDTHTEMQDTNITQLPLLFSSSFYFTLSLLLSSISFSLACRSQRVPLQNELMFTINKKCWGETAE